MDESSAPTDSSRKWKTPESDEPMVIGYVDATGCFFSKECHHFRKGGIASVLACFHGVCSNPGFSSHLQSLGFKDATFHINPELGTENPAYRRFARSLSNIMEPDSSLALVFHGTSQRNIKDILSSGLDPGKRKGQAYGPGEYFGKEPGVSVDYCHRGLKMLVFIVQLPFSVQSRGQMGRCPPEYVVVEDNARQLPLGTIHFTSVDEKVLNWSRQQRAKFQKLTKDLHDKSMTATEARTKAEIIQLLIAGKVDNASTKYQQNRTFLTLSSKREIAMYVRKQIDEEVIFYYFEGLPEPYSSQQFDEGAVMSVEEVESEASKAKEKLDEENQRLMQQRQRIQG